jgi:hypothetical protein
MNSRSGLRIVLNVVTFLPIGARARPGRGSLDRQPEVGGVRDGAGDRDCAIRRQLGGGLIEGGLVLRGRAI